MWFAFSTSKLGSMCRQMNKKKYNRKNKLKWFYVENNMRFKPQKRYNSDPFGYSTTMNQWNCTFCIKIQPPIAFDLILLCVKPFALSLVNE